MHGGSPFSLGMQPNSNYPYNNYPYYPYPGMPYNYGMYPSNYYYRPNGSYPFSQPNPSFNNQMPPPPGQTSGSHFGTSPGLPQERIHTQMVKEEIIISSDDEKGVTPEAPKIRGRPRIKDKGIETKR